MTPSGRDEIEIPLGPVTLPGYLEIPDAATGLVVFSHGSGSSRDSPRNNQVAEVIRERGVGTLLFDLLTEEEDEVYETRFDIDLLTDRLVAVADWLHKEQPTSELALGMFGSSTGAASALRAAAARPGLVQAVVSRGGRVDLASEILGEVEAPTLFIVGGTDSQVLDLNQEALEQLTCQKDLHVVEGAGHLFEQPEQLEEVSRVASDWFEQHIGGG